jgi:hypothetical protein
MKKKYYSYSYPFTLSLPTSIFLDKGKGKKGELQKSNEYCHSVITAGPSPVFIPKMIRQYTFTCEQDFIDIKEGFCPSYAVYWLDEHNRSHWPEGTVIRHRPEYLKKKEDLDNETSLSKNSSVSELSIEFEKDKIVRFDLFREIIPIFDDYIV